MKKVRIVSLMAGEVYDQVITGVSEEKLRSFSDLHLNHLNEPPSDADIADLLKNTDGCLTGWGVSIPEAAITGTETLRIIGHTAGSVKPVVPQIAFTRGITVLSAWRIMARSVGEMTLALSIAGLRNFAAHDYAFKNRGTPGDPLLRGPSTKGGLRHTFGLHHSTVGIIGASAAGRYFIKLLKAFGKDVRILVFDPYLTHEDAGALGVKKVSLAELLTSSDVVSLHAPHTKETSGMMGKNEFAMMKDGALFINTARGALVDHNALYEELKTVRLKACLDVYLETCSEPVKSRYRQLSNVLITPGIAGPTAQTLKEMGDTIVEDLRRFFAGEAPENRVDPKRLAIIA